MGKMWRTATLRRDENVGEPEPANRAYQHGEKKQPDCAQSTQKKKFRHLHKTRGGANNRRILSVQRRKEECGMCLTKKGSRRLLGPKRNEDTRNKQVLWTKSRKNGTLEEQDRSSHQERCGTSLQKRKVRSGTGGERGPTRQRWRRFRPETTKHVPMYWKK